MDENLKQSMFAYYEERAPEYEEIYTLGKGPASISDPDGSISDVGPYGGPDAESWDLDWDGYDEWWLPGSYDPSTSADMDCDDRDAEVYPGEGC